jgi:DNA-binding NarL/FixJ family response regulator
LGYRVLIVEDDSLQAESLEALLELGGHSVCGIAATARDAVAIANTEHPDVVFMDVDLRGPIDGVVAAQRIKANGPSPIIFMTGCNDPGTVARMHAVGADAILEKPARAREIMTTVRRVGRGRS